MMLSTPDYTIDALLHESKGVAVYRARANRDDSPVILKTLSSEYPSTADIARLKHEYEIVKSLDTPGVVKPYGLETHRNSPLLILEDFGGESLASVIASKKLGLHEQIGIAIQLAEIIGFLHQNQVIHKDVKPENIIYNGETGQVKISDFSISSKLPRENQTIGGPSLLEGTFSYMSPEQTGRMNRIIDYRSDFYSMGVTLYEMFTGTLPFQSTEPMELVHCHIARKPVPPHDVDPDIPSSISAVVMKLMAKTAEKRYQSAYGIKVDLETCLEMLLDPDRGERFTPGLRDISEQFEIPQKLYGREPEVGALLNTFEFISQGGAEVTLVAGYSGIGKSMLVNEIHKPIVRARGYFISGKFDQYKRHIPYSALIQAFRELIHQFLAEDDAQIQVWKKKLLAALEFNGQLIIDVIPEVELIIGPQPAPSSLPASEAKNHFNRVFLNFIHVFAREAHPLTIFMDDLQWADSASLELIKLLVTDPDTRYLMMIGAYRDNEVSPTHILTRTVQEIESGGVRVSIITLHPLKAPYIIQLIADTLGRPAARVRPLAELVLEKTGGNPFFVNQLFRHLYREGSLTFNSRIGEWEWDIEQIRDIGISDNVVKLMVSKIRKLSEPTRNVLKLAACIGARFDLNVLAIVNEQTRSDTAEELWEALEAGLIIPRGEAYKASRYLNHLDELTIEYNFLHDRVQQAAYTLIPEEHKKKVHLKVGRLLFRNHEPGDLDEKIFDIVNQLNIGVEFIEERSEKYDLARLNLHAGRKAKAGAAYEAALNYLLTGLSLLGEESWRTHYDLTLNLHVTAVEVEYLNTDFKEAHRLSEIVFERAKTTIDKVRVYVVKIQFFIARNQMSEAIVTALSVIELLGYPLDPELDELSLVRELPAMDELEWFPEMTDPAQLAVLDVLTIVSGALYQARPDLLPVIVYKMVNHCLSFGHSKYAAYSYGVYGLIMCGPDGDIEKGYHSGKLSLRMLDQFHARDLECKTRFAFNSFVRHWKEPHRDSIPALVKLIHLTFETGDYVYATYCCLLCCGYQLHTGESLASVERSQGQYVDMIGKMKQEYGFYTAKIFRQLTLNLQGVSEDKYQLKGESFNDEDFQHLSRMKNRMLIFYYHFAKLLLAYIYRDYTEAAASAKRAAELAAAASAQMLYGIFVLYDSLAHLAVYPGEEDDEQREIMRRVASNQERTREWARHGPMNFQNKYELVEAEKARVLSRAAEAMDHYERAIALSRENGFIQETAIAAER
ncbi:MAG: serine/threonine-protein kinase PknK, partial [Desulfobacterales bacterium]|nr:serine/threonine-protein kinase PknK [Desulfobacterales bacterium]